MLFSFEKEPKRTRQNRRSQLREDATQLACWEMAGRAEWRATAAAGLSRLTGYRAGKLRANELQAEAELHAEVRLSLFAIDQFSLSCPPLHHRSRTRWRPVRPRRIARRLAPKPALFVFSPVQTAAALFRSTNTLRRHNSSNRTHLSRTHSSMGSRYLIVEDLQNGRELEGSMRFATRNRKNRVNIGLSALRGDS